MTVARLIYLLELFEPEAEVVFTVSGTKVLQSVDRAEGDKQNGAPDSSGSQRSSSWQACSRRVRCREMNDGK